MDKDLIKIVIQPMTGETAKSIPDYGRKHNFNAIMACAIIMT